MAARFQMPVLVATLLVLPAILVEQSAASPGLRATAAAINWAIWVVFAAELAAMLAVVPSRRAWLRLHPLELAIVVLTVPLWPTSLQAARLFRLARLLRLVLVFRLARRLLSPQGLEFAAAVVGICVLGGAAAYTSAEANRNFGDGIWWAISTVTTVGYGDIAPHTALGRAAGVVLMLVGIGFLGLLTGAIAQRFVQVQTGEARAAGARIEGYEREIAEELHEIATRLADVQRRIAELDGEQPAAAET